MRIDQSGTIYVNSINEKIVTNHNNINIIADNGMRIALPYEHTTLVEGNKRITYEKVNGHYITIQETVIPR